MKKEDLKAAIKANFENNKFATAMKLNNGLFQEYEELAIAANQHVAGGDQQYEPLFRCRQGKGRGGEA